MHANERLIRDFYAAQGRFYAGEDVSPAVSGFLAEDIAWHVPGRNAIAGDYVGVDAVLAYFTRRRDLARRSMRVTVHRVLADDEYVIQLAGGEAEVGGERRTWETVGVFRVAGGRIAECWLVPFDQLEFDEIWAGVKRNRGT
jgi:ketosteroid isomerase-like protein